MLTTYHFDGVIDQTLTGADQNTPTDSLPIHTGDTFIGQLTFDSAAAFNPDTGGYNYAGAPEGMTVAFDSSTFTTAGGNEQLTIIHAPTVPLDSVLFQERDALTTAALAKPTEMHIELDNYAANIFSDSSIPGQINFADFTAHILAIGHRDSDHPATNYELIGHLNSFHTPEPATIILFLSLIFHRSITAAKTICRKVTTQVSFLIPLLLQSR